MVVEMSLCVISLLSSLSQVVIARVEVTGNSRLETQRILKEFDVERGDSLREGEIQARVERVLAVYRDIGHWRAEIDIESYQLEEGRVAVKLRIDEGEPVLVEKMAVEGNSLFTDGEILSQFGTKVGDPFRESLFREDVDDLLRRYGNVGHPFCKVSPKDFSVDGSRIGFSLLIEEGPRVVIEKVKVEGNHITKPYVILRELGVREGEVYRRDRIDRGRRKVGRLPFLVGEPQIELKPRDGVERVALIVKVVEGMMNSIRGALGWLPKEEGNGELTGVVDLTLGNLFGTGRRIEANWTRISPLSSLLKLGYCEPGLFGKGVNLSLRFSHAIQDTSYTENDLTLNLELPFREEISGNCSVGRERVIPGNFPVPKSTKYKGSFGAVLDMRDNPKNPRGGLLYRFSTEYGYKRNFPTELLPDPEERARVVKVEFGLENFLQVLSHQVLYFSLNGGEVRSTESLVPQSEHFRLGGAKTIRGYYEEQFSGERVSWGSLEYRFLMGRSSRIGPFLDAGYFQYQKEKDRPVEAWKLGYGLGMGVGTAWGVFFLDYGLGEGDGPLEGKVHFGVETEF